MTRYLEFIDGIACNELRTSGTVDVQSVPDGRLMIDVTDRPDVHVGDTYTGAATRKVFTATADTPFVAPVKQT